MPPVPDILIVRLSAMGDVLLTTPLLRALRVAHPQARITFVTRRTWLPLLAHNPRLTRALGWEPAQGSRALRESLGRDALRGLTHRLDLQNNLRSRLLRRALGGKWSTWSNHRLARTVLIRTKRDTYRDRRPVAERYFDAARSLGVTPDAGSLELFLPRSSSDQADEFLSGMTRQILAIAPGAAHPTKRWPLHHWVALSRRLLELGSDVLVIGGEMDREKAGAIVAQAESEVSAGSDRGAVIRSAAGLDLLDTAALLKKSRALVAGDTGQMHLATAMGTPVIALFGPTVEAFGFFPYHAKATVLQMDLPCRPCSAHGGPRCPLQHHRCLQDLQPDLVLEALRKLPR